MYVSRRDIIASNYESMMCHFPESRLTFAEFFWMAPFRVRDTPGIVRVILQLQNLRILGTIDVLQPSRAAGSSAQD